MQKNKASMDGAVGRYSKDWMDRYGHEKYLFYGEAYAFSKSYETSTLRLGVKYDEDEYEWIKFKNISLVPGKDAEFEIERGP